MLTLPTGVTMHNNYVKMNYQRRAFTLIEMLVAMACTLVLMGAVVNLFGEIGDSVSNSRGMIEISERVRNARNRLQLDLEGITATTVPPLRPEEDQGYFEICEGTNRDYGNKNFLYLDLQLGDPGFELTGDADDVLMFTTHSRGQPFVGRFEDHSSQRSETFESELAEVIWYTVEQPQRVQNIGPKLYTLYRRVLLIAPRSISKIDTDDLDNLSVIQFQHVYDLSVRREGNRIRLNTLGDLTKREYRWWHFPTGNNGFPYPVPLTSSNPFHRYNGEVAMLLERSHDGTSINRVGEDVVLTNVLSFDVKVFDPAIELRVDSSGIVLTPTDPGYAAGNATGMHGAFVDLNNGTTVTGLSGPMELKSMLSGPATYDTWSLHYENNLDANGNPIDEDGVNGANGAFNGFDDNPYSTTDIGYGVIDDPTERDAIAPYQYPLRGIQVKIRVYEPDTRQIREVTVVQDFLPE